MAGRFPYKSRLFFQSRELPVSQSKYWHDFVFFFFLPVEEAAFLLTSQVRNDTQGIFKKVVTAGFSVQSSRGFDFFRGSNKSTLFLRHANPSTDTQIKRSLTVNKSNSQKYCNTSSFRRVFNDRVYRL